MVISPKTVMVLLPNNDRLRARTGSLRGGRQATSAEGKKVHVVSIPCVDVFDEQIDAYKEKVLPKAVSNHMVEETAESFGWHCYIGLDGVSSTMKRVAASTSSRRCLNELGKRWETWLPKTKL